MRARSPFDASLARAAATLLVLHQVRLAAAPVPDGPAFLAAVAAAAALGLLLGRSRLAAPLGLAGFPVLYAVLYAAAAWMPPAVLGPGPAADSILLAFERNALVALVPAAWAWASALLACRSTLFLRVLAAADGAVLAAVFAFRPSRLVEAYDKPVYLLAALAALCALEFAALGLSALGDLPPAPDRPAPNEKRKAAVFAFAAAAVVGALLLGPLEDRAVSSGGGLLKPNLLSFDFSQFLRLESEISLKDDLALIVRKEEDDYHYLLRRFVLSGYERRRGFFRDPGRDDAEQPPVLPPSPVDYPAPDRGPGKAVEQEYYLVNFDPDAFVALPVPTRVVPYENWDASSFVSVYSVSSATSEVLPFELASAEAPADASPPPGAAALDLSDADYRFYTDYGGDARIAELAASIAGDLDGYWEKVAAVHERLKYGEYRYSLKPGPAPDGDQLGRFLFDAKKGYCSYFAFSMALLVRSLGIPARVAVGFYLDHSIGALGYYPVRSDMAHAWTEVWFPGHGWIEFDPTTEMTAEGEAFRDPPSTPPDAFQGLVREILDNKERVQRTVDPEEGAKGGMAAAAAAAAFLRRHRVPLLALLWAAAACIARCGRLAAALAARMGRSPRREAAALRDHAAARLRLYGYRPLPGESAAGRAARMDGELGPGFAALEEERARARFAPDYGDPAPARAAYAQSSRTLRGSIPLPRRALAWAAPWICLLLPPARRRSRTGSEGGPRPGAALLVLAVAAALASRSASAQDADAAGASRPAADVLYESALLAAASERWSQAIDAFEAGKAAYPADPRFPTSLGDLFAERELYSLAWTEYRKAEALNGDDPDLLYRLSRAAGRLNMDARSAAYLERVVARRPSDRDAIADLGWMYFKLHRLADAERLLLDALARLGADRGFSMTLATVYSNLFDYERSKERYLEAIADARTEGAKTFLAVAQYNLSILDSRFYRYPEALDHAAESILSSDRSSGHLAKGELHLRRLDFPRVFAEYAKAAELDASPLSKINLADAYLRAGRVEEARAFAEDALSSRDLSWMLNFGTDVDQHLRDLHGILEDAYAALAVQAASPREPGPFAAVRGLARAAAHSLRAAYHRALREKHTLRAAAAFSAEGQDLEALTNYYAAFRRHPARARPYLERAAALEGAAVPPSLPTYALERAVLDGDAAGIAAAQALLDPVWQKDLLAEGHEAAAVLARKAGDAEAFRAAVEKLYALNRGAPRRAGFRLPVSVEAPALGAGLPPAWRDALRRAGLDPAASAGLRYRLKIDVAGPEAACVLHDTVRGADVAKASIPASPGAVFSTTLSSAIFRVE